MWFRRSIGAALAAAALAFLAGCGSSGTSSPGTNAGPGDAFVYATNANGNTLSAFANDSNGALTAVPGSPFAIAGEPLGMAVAPSRKFLYVAALRNNLVDGFSIAATNGVVTPLSCPMANTGLQPLNIAITPSGAFLYTADQGGSDITAFTLDANTGCLTFLQTATIAVPRALAVERAGHFLYVSTGGGVQVFSIAADGTLTLQALAGFDNGRADLWDLVADPAADLLFVVESSSSYPGAVYVLSINPSTGALTNITNSPFLTGGALANGIAVNSTGTAVFVGSAVAPSTDQGGVTDFAIGAGGALAITGSPFPGAGPEDLALDPSGKFLYGVFDLNTVGSVAVFSIGSGGVTRTGTSNLGTGPHTVVVVAHP